MADLEEWAGETVEDLEGWVGETVADLEGKYGEYIPIWLNISNKPGHLFAVLGSLTFLFECGKVTNLIRDPLPF